MAGKATLTALLLRAGEQTHDAALTQMGTDLTHLALNAALDDGSPLGKIQGLCLSKLHAAVARLAAASAPCGLPGDLDRDGDLDIVDIMLVAVHWGETC